jgi:UDP-galactopyranose mutase
MGGTCTRHTRRPCQGVYLEVMSEIRANPAGWDLACATHLWWDWVWQRPQQLLTRIARRNRVLWIEEPRLAIGPPGDVFEVAEEWPNLWVGRMAYRSDPLTFRQRLEAHAARFGPAGFDPSSEIRQASLLFQGAPLRDLEREVSAVLPGWRQRERLVLWLYTPAAIGFIDLLRPDLVVYDVMDDLGAFKFAQASLRAQQDALLARADLVFAGGPSIRDGIVSRRPDVHLFPSGVDRQHFARALDPALPLPADVAGLPRPIVGFIGVIDERIDLALLDKAARQKPEWSWVLVGPVTKISPDALPRSPNLHYIGKRDYDHLPAYLKAFDVAMMPFALNEATRSISPTKTLEYMAAHKPIVSTPIRDVVDLYGPVVRVAQTPTEFVETIENLLGEGQAARAEREERESVLLAASAWDAIADTMHALLEDRLAKITPQGQVPASGRDGRPVAWSRA